ncbi:hypothetical protein [Sphingomonas immobilis]|uniref:Helix-hairpin-helix domain-containing protein n=1 Tax=Sphingomonas immobilis TaxID=3063997 RepID=A0ABT9A620_9SPHN|nr:hypothetical protein [Sphingomonas sp. CA1-15]MDO7844685.1 hypothetical protein [Sphingomonas sp. CA1-15]
MLSPSQLATANLEDARQLRACGHSYRQIGRRLGLSSGQLSHIRRTLKREKAAHTRLRSQTPNATFRDFPISQTVLPPGLRSILQSAGFVTLGDLADRSIDPARAGLGVIQGIGPYRASMIKRLLDHHHLLPGADNLQTAVEEIFPEFI